MNSILAEPVCWKSGKIRKTVVTLKQFFFIALNYLCVADVNLSTRKLFIRGLRERILKNDQTENAVSFIALKKKKRVKNVSFIGI